MDKKKQPAKPVEIPAPIKYPEIGIPHDPEEPITLPPEEEPDVIPEEDPFEALPFEMPPDGEGP